MTDLRTTHWRSIRDSLQGKRLVVHDRLGIHGPVTAKELADIMNWDKCSVRPRIVELCHLGLANATGLRRNGENVFAYVSLARAEEMARIGQERAPAQVGQLPLFA